MGPCRVAWAAVFGLGVFLGSGIAHGEEDAAASYSRRFIAFREEVSRDDADRVRARWLVPVQGVDQVPLKGERFYEALGREDLATEYRGRQALKTTLLVVGVGGIAAGGVLFYDGLSRCPPRPDGADAVCETPGRSKVGLAVAGLGAALTIASTLVDAQPVDAARAQRLVDEFNLRLKAKLGLGHSIATRPGATAERVGVSLSVAPVSLPEGAKGLRLKLTY